MTSEEGDAILHDVAVQGLPGEDVSALTVSSDNTQGGQVLPPEEETGGILSPVHRLWESPACDCHRNANGQCRRLNRWKRRSFFYRITTAADRSLRAFLKGRQTVYSYPPPLPSTPDASLSDVLVGPRRRVIVSTLYGLLQQEILTDADVVLDPTLTAMISMDVGRTFPDTPFFKGSGQKHLERVLRAYAVFDPAVGYVQGMNFLAAALLYHSTAEAEAFWLFVTLFHQYNLRRMFLPGLPGLRYRCGVVERLLATASPDVSNILIAAHVPMEILATDWLLTLFAYTIPLDCLGIFWDQFFNEGWVAVYRLIIYHLVQLQGFLESPETALQLARSASPDFTRAQFPDGVPERMVILSSQADLSSLRSTMPQTKGTGGAAPAEIEHCANIIMICRSPRFLLLCSSLSRRGSTAAAGPQEDVRRPSSDTEEAAPPLVQREIGSAQEEGVFPLPRRVASAPLQVMRCLSSEDLEFRWMHAGRQRTEAFNRLRTGDQQLGGGPSFRRTPDPLLRYSSLSFASVDATVDPAQLRSCWKDVIRMAPLKVILSPTLVKQLEKSPDDQYSITSPTRRATTSEQRRGSLGEQASRAVRATLQNLDKSPVLPKQGRAQSRSRSLITVLRSIF